MKLKLKLKLICDRQSVGQFVWVSGLPMGPLTRFYLPLLFSADNYLIILLKASSLTRRRVCSLQWNHSLVPRRMGEWIYIYVFLTSLLDGVEWSASRSGYISPSTSLRSLQSRSGLPERVKNNLPLLGIKPQFFGHPVRSLSLYRLNYPCPSITALSYVLTSASLSERQCKPIELLPWTAHLECLPFYSSSSFIYLLFGKLNEFMLTIFMSFLHIISVCKATLFYFQFV
jgi:hypothetical protein